MTLLERFNEARLVPNRPVIVLGDIMLDEYVSCDVLGHSPEDELAHKLKVFGTPTYRLGGAANVANNLVSLGLYVHIFGYTGHDERRYTLWNMMKDRGIRCWVHHPVSGSPTIIKTRYVTRRGRQVIRVDTEEEFDVKPAFRRKLLDECLGDKLDHLFVVSDYKKGTVDETTIEWLAEHKCRYIVDPKQPDFGFYRKPVLITPNEQELIRATSKSFSEASTEARLQLATAQSGAVLVTLSGKGSMLCVQTINTGRLHHLGVRCREVGDPAGCGDSLLAGVAFGLVCGWTLELACRFGNACGACAMDHLGVNAVSPEEVIKELNSYNYEEIK
jgi:D-beta-D-heptose 7-phosphate kinase/D-beta-D-heptose 1-phosphate adenosyltransferase